MNDRYLFKAKRVDNGEWVVGYLCRTFRWLGDKEPVAGIQESDCFCFRQIDESTICQCTGLKDKNGTLIWENDIAEISTEDGYFSIDWDEDTVRFVMNGDGLTVDFDNFWPHEVEVVGNRMDNPGLLEVE